MKTLQIITICLLCTGVFIAVMAFKPGTTADQRQAVQQNFKPVQVNCQLSTTGQVYAFRNSCVASQGNICVATQCEGFPVDANRKPVLRNCTRSGKIYAFANDCVAQNNAVCRVTTCP